MERITINHAYEIKKFIQTQEQARRRACNVFIASRAALRVAPYAIQFFEFDPICRQRDLTSLVIWRPVMIASCAASSGLDVSVSDIAYVAGFNASEAAYVAASSVANAAFAAALAVADAASNASFIADAFDINADAINASAALAATSADILWAEVSRDAELWLDHADQGDGRLAITIAPLWSNENPLERDWHNLREKLLAADTPDPRGADWSFWVKWYDDILAGNPQNWDMLYEIATTDAIDWDASAREVNDRINQIVERYRLRDEVGALRRELEEARAAQANRAQRSHNMPPELVDEIPEIEERLTIVWAAAQEAENELEKTKPDPTILSKFAKIILDFGIWFTKYCGHISNFALKAGITASWGSASVYYLKNDTHLIAELGKQLLDFASKLGVF